MHNGMLQTGGEKMSKSLGNVLDLQSLLEQYDPRAYRLALVQAHYRAPMEMGPDQMAAADQALSRLDSLARRLREVEVTVPPENDLGLAVSAGGEVTSYFKERMDDDLDTPRAIATVFDAVRSANAALDRGDRLAALRLGRQALYCAEAVGISAESGGGASEDALVLARRRDEARAARDFEAADRIRDELNHLGYRVEDTPGGTRVYR
jgi:cysteinyl-tRNA synthetase